MSGPRWPLGWYRAAPRGARLHVAIRWVTCPFGAVEAELPADGSLLDWGCGHGVLAAWAAHRAPARVVHGVDIDADKLIVAEAAARAAGVDRRTSFSVVGSDDLPVGSWRSVVVNDVLYLLDPVHQARLIAACARALEPGGVLVAKVMGPDPSWKVRATEVQEALSVRTLRITESGGGIHPSPPIDTVISWMADAGLDAVARRVDRGYHCPHVLVVGRRPG